ncbi:hypothetical protein TrLO_g1736 [Triparma laevis f. longispina]|uniref:Uncharacterized protein n=1 Tax=Triparma laevis f. longispina TaxID=1714387 RepID=A0A9W7C7N8_9STRA|nr:hypothetical protein TrLO_g1736 [Triparma laevis f. longispina]
MWQSSFAPTLPQSSILRTPSPPFSPSSALFCDPYGFDDQQEDPDSERNQAERRDAKLRKSLEDSAKFKMTNDARFTWATLTVSFWSYAYAVLDKDFAQNYLPMIGLPNLGIPGAVLSLLVGSLSAVLFVDPAFFRRRR